MSQQPHEVEKGMETNFRKQSANSGTIPGLKVAYGQSAAQPRGQFGSLAQNDKQEQKGLFGRLKDSIFHMVTEEAEADRPIGISQLSRKTFAATDDSPIVRSGRNMTDYRFNQLINNNTNYQA